MRRVRMKDEERIEEIKGMGELAVSVAQGMTAERPG